MDGNGRWATRQGMKRTEGHYAGYKRLKKTALYILDKGVKYLMSFDGKSGNVDNTCSVVPEECYEQHLYIKSGNSSFKRVTGNDKNSMVYESLYMNFHNEYNGLF